METGYCDLHSKEVINLRDGKRLGKVCDVVFTFPEAKVLGIVVPENKCFFSRQRLFIDLSAIVKIGVDAVLVDVHDCCAPTHGRSGRVQEDSCGCS